MNKTLKTTLGIVGIVTTVGILISCNSFCSNEDTAHFRYAYDPINTRFFETQEQAEDYIVSQIQTIDGVTDSENLTINDLQIYSLNESGTEKVKVAITDANISDVIGTFNNNLVYLKPQNIYYQTTTETESGSSTNYNSYVTFGLSSFSTSIINSTASAGVLTPALAFYEELDLKVIDKILNNASTCGYGWLENSQITRENLTFTDLYGYSYSSYLDYVENPTDEKLNYLLGGEESEPEDSRTRETGFGRNHSLLTTLGYLKFDNSNLSEEYDAWEQIETWNKEIQETLGDDQAMSSNYLSAYQTNLNNTVSNIRSCITIEDGFYGHTSNDPLSDTVRIEGKAVNFWEGWGNAFAQHGFLEGLLVYPISTMVETFSHAFGMNGVGQILAVLLVTLIVRGLFMLVTFPSTVSTQKMQYLQPELAKLQQKYPNYTTNDYEKQRYAQAQMALYKKHKVHPFSSFLVIIIQFPVFISVWNALTGSASLSRDAVLGLRLSDTIWNTLTNFAGWPASAGWWTALVLILLMSAAQIVSMMLPQILSKKRAKNIQKLGVSPSQNQQQKTMKWVQIFMTGMIIFMGFTLPSAMGVYWLCGAIFSIIQTLIMHLILVKKKKER